jgi:hypothetical protein
LRNVFFVIRQSNVGFNLDDRLIRPTPLVGGQPPITVMIQTLHASKSIFLIGTEPTYRKK